MNRIVAVVGMCGSGKSVACDVFRAEHWTYIRFGQITIDGLKKQKREVTPENEKEMREGLRRRHGMGAFALLSLPKIEAALKEGNVIIDGLYSWSEYKILKKKFRENMQILCLYASPAVRYSRLEARAHEESDREHRMRRLTSDQARNRDYSEIENIEKGGPIAMADHTIVNHGSTEDLIRQVRDYLKNLN